ncbi:MAG: hypothetical protein JSR51_05375 [Proteobacteria bacterium]|nr:hypothetical protein [Pseudomonadota bacterium]
MTKTELAKKLGISRQMLYKLVDLGMPLDLQAATEWRSKKLDFFKTKAGRIDGNSGGRAVSIPSVSNETTGDTRSLEELQAAVDSASQLNLDGTDADELYKNSRALKEKAQALAAKLELDLASGNVVVRDDVHKAAFEASRKLRDNLHSLCKQAAPNVIGMTAPEAIETYLRDEVDRMLQEFIETCV